MWVGLEAVCPVDERDGSSQDLGHDGCLPFLLPFFHIVLGCNHNKNGNDNNSVEDLIPNLDEYVAGTNWKLKVEESS